MVLGATKAQFFFLRCSMGTHASDSYVYNASSALFMIAFNL